MRARRSALLAVALGAAAVFAACREEKSAGPPRRIGFDEVEDVTPSPTPVPLRGGAWAVAISGTGSRCGLDVPAETVYLDGRARAWQLAAEPSLLDAHGAWDGTSLTLTAGAHQSWRPEIDCVVGNEEIWSLAHARSGVVASSLSGTLTFVRFAIAGADCDGVAPGIPELLLDTHAGVSRAVVVAPAMKLRAAASKNAAVVAYLDRGAVVSVLGDDSPWEHVRDGRLEGWAREEDLRPACVDRHDVRLSWQSARTAPRVAEAAAGEGAAPQPTARAPESAFAPFALDPEAEPTSAPDLFAKEAPRPAPTAAPAATPKPAKPKSKGKSKTRRP